MEKEIRKAIHPPTVSADSVKVKAFYLIRYFSDSKINMSTNAATSFKK